MKNLYYATLIKLIHPKHGEISARQTNFGTTTYDIIQQWKYKYGKKYSECSTEIKSIGKSKDYLRAYNKS